MDSNMKNILIEVRALLAKGWCQKEYATTATGDPVSEYDPRAASFCFLGAFHKARNILGLHSSKHPGITLTDYEQALHIDNVVYYNDFPGRTKEEILALIDEALS